VRACPVAAACCSALTLAAAVGGLYTTAVYSPYVTYPQPFYGGGTGGSVVVVGRKLLAAAPSAAPGGSCKSAAEVIAATPELSQLGGLAGKASPQLLSELTSKSGPAFTLFAPSNAALQTLTASLGSPEMLTNNATALTALLSYHLVPGAALTAAQLSDGQQLKTALGGPTPPLIVRKSEQGVLIQGVGSEAAVVKPDLRTCRGVIHVVETVLIPVQL